MSARAHQLRVTPIAVVVADAVAGVAHVERQLRDAGDIGAEVLGGLASAHHPGGRDLDPNGPEATFGTEVMPTELRGSRDRLLDDGDLPRPRLRRQPAGTVKS